jgi:uncharacterized protein
MTRITLAALLAVLTLAPAASAHVTVQPKELPAGEFTVINVRVPNEKDDEGTTKVEVQMPPGFAFASYQPIPGWKVEIERGKADPPIEVHGEPVNDQVTKVTFTGDGKEGIIGPGQFIDFPLSVSVPSKVGDTLTFKALQTYEKGEVVRWIGAEDSEKPAPTATLVEAGGGHGGAAQAEATAEPTGASVGAGEEDEDEDETEVLPIIALVVGGLGLLTGLAALAAARRTRVA